LAACALFLSMMSRAERRTVIWQHVRFPTYCAGYL
jgi:hypothetical protein